MSDDIKTLKTLGEIIDFFFSMHPTEAVRIIRPDGEVKIFSTYHEAKEFWNASEKDK